MGVSGDADEVELESLEPGRGGLRRRRLMMLGGAALAAAAATGVVLRVADRPSPNARIADEPAALGTSREARDGDQGVVEQQVATPSVRSAETAIAVQTIEFHTGLGGGEDIIFVFDRTLPDSRVTCAPDISDVDAPGIAYTVQDPSARIWVCDDYHFGAGLGPTGSVDVLIPSDWWRPGAPVHEVPYESVPPLDAGGDYPDSPDKTVGCGPYNGYIQYSVWAPASDDPADVSVHVSDDSTRIVVEVRPAQG